MRHSLWFTDLFPWGFLFWSVFWLLFLAAAAVLVRRIRRPHPGFTANLCLFTCSLLGAFLVAETGLRLAQRVTRRIERASFVNNNLGLRPFLVDGRIEYRFPAVLGRTRLFLSAHSRVLGLLLTQIQRFLAVLAERGWLRTVERDIEQKGMDFAPFRASVGTTEALIERFKRRAGEVPVIAFTVDDKQPFLEAFERIFARNGIVLVEDVERSVSLAEKTGKVVRLDGEHWNELGHRIAGETLGEALAAVVGNHGATEKAR